MSLRVWTLSLLAISVFAFAACGDDDDDGGGKKTIGCYESDGETCTGTAEYEACMFAACDSEFAACYGPKYKSGSFSGPCGEFMQCQSACGCDENTDACLQKCLPKATQECQGCAVNVGKCTQTANCKEPVCTHQGGEAGSGAGGSAGSGSGSGCNSMGATLNCSKLEACCEGSSCWYIAENGGTSKQFDCAGTDCQGAATDAVAFCQQ